MHISRNVQVRLELADNLPTVETVSRQHQRWRGVCWILFRAQINNDRTRKAYLNTTRRFAALCDGRGIGRLGVDGKSLRRRIGTALESVFPTRFVVGHEHAFLGSLDGSCENAQQGRALLKKPGHIPVTTR